MSETISPSRHPYWDIWRHMINRCHKPSYPKFPQYGARGIQVCEQWRADFWQFVQDVGERPDVSHSLDRERVNGNYEPGNVKWSTEKEQCRNKTNNRLITAFGVTQPAAAWIEQIGCPSSSFYKWLKAGFSVEDIYKKRGLKRK